MTQRVDIEVVHVAESVRGGVATYLRHLLPLQKDRYGAGRVAVVAPGDQVPDLGDPQGVQMIGFRRSKSRLISAWRARRKVLQLVGETPARRIHIHSTFAGISCRLFRGGALKRTRLIYCAHGWASIRRSQSRWFAAVTERLLARVTDLVICVSEAERREGARIGIAPCKLATIPNGLPDSSLPAHPAVKADVPNHLRLLFIGRFDRAKGLDLLFAALNLIERSVSVEVYGASVLGDTEAVAVPANAILHGWQTPEAIAEGLVTCHAVIVPSRWEAFGFVALEAMRAGKPVIGTRVGGLKDLVVDGETGYLVRPDDPHDLAETIEKLDLGELQKMGEAGRRRFLESFQIGFLEIQLAKVYEEVTAES